jgi:hypothetical protein
VIRQRLRHLQLAADPPPLTPARARQATVDGVASAERQNVEQDATREERFNVVYAELLQTVCAANLLLCEAVVVPWLVPDYDPDVAQAVELRSHLADFTIKHFVVEHELLVTKRTTRRATRNRDREMALPKERNAGLKIHAHTVDLSSLDQLRCLEHLGRSDALGCTDLILCSP